MKPIQRTVVAGPLFKLSSVQIFMGLNIHCGFPAIAGRLDCGPGSPTLSMDRIATLPAYFISVSPELASMEFLPALDQSWLAPDPPAALATTLAWLTAQLQNLGNACVGDIAIDRASNRDVLALSGYQVPEVAAQAMQLACALIAAGWESREPSGPTAAAQSDLRQTLASFLQFARSWHLDVQTHAIVSAARARNIPHYRLCPSARFIQLGQGTHQQHIYETISDRTSDAGAKIAHNKIATHHLLRSLGVPTADQIPVATYEQAAAAAAQMGYPVVVKPSHGLQARGVTVGVRNPRELKAAHQAAVDAGLGGILVEKFVPGHHHRLTVIGGRLVTAVKWIPAQVAGDGIHSVEELIAVVNADPGRGDDSGYDFDFGRKRVRLVPNPEMNRMLAAQGCEYASVPPPGRIVRLQGTATIASGGDGMDVSGQVHPEVREMAELIALAFKLDVVGIDYLTDDVARSCRDGGGAVCEVNACPGFQGHFLIGIDRDRIMGALLQLHFPAGQTGRVPTAAIAGGPGAAAVARLLAHVLETSGKTTALAYSGGVTIGAHQVRAEESAGGVRARAMMMDPRVEAAVMELDCDMLLGAGMPVDANDVGAVLGVEFERPRQDGIDSVAALRAVKLLVPRAATRYAVLNADDPHCVSMAAELRHVPLCWVSVEPDTPALAIHRQANGMTATLTETGGQMKIVVAKGTGQQCAVAIRDVPAVVQGSTRVVEALFAAAMACALDIPCAQITAALGNFQRDSVRD